MNSWRQAFRDAGYTLPMLGMVVGAFVLMALCAFLSR